MTGRSAITKQQVAAVEAEDALRIPGADAEGDDAATETSIARTKALLTTMELPIAGEAAEGPAEDPSSAMVLTRCPMITVLKIALISDTSIVNQK
mmetsp:Transcript_36125/g.108108  ORF Transcript_36125/g.108108 Transcript_36125/m.108108 type:complete len:95 (+) Transcript_36125:1580-1864(+)